MELLIDFIVENYIWVIIIGIVVLMTIIGYIADKTEFGKKSMKNENDKGKNVDSYEEQPQVEVPVTENIEPINAVEENIEPAFEMPQMESFIEEEQQVEVPATEDIEPINAVEENIEPTFEMPEMESFIEEEQPFELNAVEENIEPAFETDEMQNLEEQVVVPTVEEQPEEVLDKKALKKLQKEEAKRAKEEAKRQKEEAKKQKNVKEEIEVQPVEQIENIDVQPVENFSNVEPEKQEVASDLFESMEEPTLQVEEENEIKLEEPAFNTIEEIPEIDLPSIESLEQELNDDAEEDDVWKF